MGSACANVSSDDGTMPTDSKQAQWGPMFYKAGEVSGRPLNIFETMKESITAAGFTNVQEQLYKIPIGTWPKNKLYKEAGRLNLDQLLTGLEGYVLRGVPVYMKLVADLEIATR